MLMLTRIVHNKCSCSQESFTTSAHNICSQVLWTWRMAGHHLLSSARFLASWMSRFPIVSWASQSYHTFRHSLCCIDTQTTGDNCRIRRGGHHPSTGQGPTPSYLPFALPHDPQRHKKRVPEGVERTMPEHLWRALEATNVECRASTASSFSTRAPRKMARWRRRL